MSDLTAVILAGGMGTRIRSLYPDVPKPLIPAAGKPFLYWVTGFFAHHGVQRFVYSTGYKGDQIDRWCSDAPMRDLSRAARQEATPLGTGGALLNCLDLCGDWVLAANGDSLCLAGLNELIALASETGVDGGLIGVYQDDTSRYGSLETDADGTLLSFKEKVPGSGFVNGGVYLFKTSALQALRIEGPCSIEHDIIPRLVGSGAVLRAVTLRDVDFLDIGTPETVVLAEAFLTANLKQFDW